MMRIFVKQHQHKADGIIRALEACGYKLARRSVDLALFDVANGYQGEGFVKKALQMWQEGATIVIYPHAATPPWWYDGVWELDPRVAGILVTTETHRKIMQRYLPDTRIRSIGWIFCEQRTFEPVDDVQRILFMPIHPPYNGDLREEAREANRQAMNGLIPLADTHEIIVRYIGDLDRQGLWFDPRLHFLKALPDGSTQEIDEADLVIAEGTALHLAVARGKPAIGLNQHNPIRSNFGERSAVHWSEYADLLRYPIDISDGTLPDLIQLAKSEEQQIWRANNVGEDLDIVQLQLTLMDIYAEDCMDSIETRDRPMTVDVSRFIPDGDAL